MPFCDLQTPSGSVSLWYNILTPTSPSAHAIDRDLPTVIFFHSLYMAQEIFEPQASDPLLRRFNLVLIDFRAHGFSKGRLGTPYTPTETADDAYRILQALKLPPSHVFGLSIGSSAAIELAVAHPEQVLSLTLCSPLPPNEPEMALSGRQEIWDCWEEGIKEAPEVFIEDSINLAVYGTQQMMFNNEQSTSNTIDALMSITAGHCSGNWGWTEDKKADGYGSIATWFSTRRVLTTEDYEKITCPVVLIHGDRDLPYPAEDVQETEATMRKAGLDVTFITVDGPHYTCFVNPKSINRILHDTVIRNSKFPGPELPAHVEYMETPFHNALAEAGYFKNEDSDSDDDDMDFYDNNSIVKGSGSDSRSSSLSG